MLRQVRQRIIQTLWDSYRHSTAQMQTIDAGLKGKGIQKMVLDHFAVIDLPGPHTGIPPLSKIFSTLGYVERGKGYLADKQNDFLWMAEADTMHEPAAQALPQVVVADFRLEEMPSEIRHIIETYSQQSMPAPIAEMEQWVERIEEDEQASHELWALITRYLAGRDWPLPTVSEFLAVQSFNQLLAWVLVFGRRPNHFTVSVHHLNQFANMLEFNSYVENELKLELNHEGGKIKGGRQAGISQGSTTGISETIALRDGEVALPTGFVEFVWRYPHTPACQQPKLWNEYFTGFVAAYADHVIESLYMRENEDQLYGAPC